MIFLDSDAIIDMLRGKPSIAAFLAAHKMDLFAIPAPVLYEVYYGFYYPPLSKQFRANTRFLKRLADEQTRLQQFLNDIRVFDLTTDSIKKAAEISAQLDAAGTHVGQYDTLIAGIVLQSGYSKIATRNVDHFDRIPGIEVLKY
jgi:tRNA(fMet)-specific endonuclease VapC